MLFQKSRSPQLVEKSTARDQSVDRSGRPRILVSLDRSWYHRLGVQHLTYYRLIRRHGAVPMRIDYGGGPEPDRLDQTAESLVQGGDGLLLSGGEDVDPALYRSEERLPRSDRRRDRFELALIRAARKRGMPILGICRGCQLLNVALGGTLRSLRESWRLKWRHAWWRTHRVGIASGSRAGSILGQRHLPSVRSLHGQAVEFPADSLTICGRSEDGIVEAIETRKGDEWLVGIQWHPELMLFEHHDARLIADFIAAAWARRRGEPTPNSTLRPRSGDGHPASCSQSTGCV